MHDQLMTTLKKVMRDIKIKSLVHITRTFIYVSNFRRILEMYDYMSSSSHVRIACYVILFRTTMLLTVGTYYVIISYLRWTKCGRENKFKFIFTPVYWGEKMNLNVESTAVSPI